MTNVIFFQRQERQMEEGKMKILSLALDMILILLVSEVVKRLEIFVNFVLYSLHLDVV